MATVTLVKHSPARKDGKFPICIRVGVKRKYSYETICYVLLRQRNVLERRGQTDAPLRARQPRHEPAHPPATGTRR
ncbi:hypothetical protein [Spirosoma sp. KUDC1026]|uniref:hypothetical protein n=1 Tax=Spirosoma sp. KUDC1026 TaxID=2745947 RepID=UPI00159BD986|nr:hypothetical protein [Spirosoma sp. KUDC1026]QKZ14199.1 hypothetical protein HU175_16820 [Spirosoma sp. KUDC1026]